jgi:hypothetical protein
MYQNFHFMLTEFEVLPPTVNRTTGSVQAKATGIRIGWYMLRKKFDYPESKEHEILLLLPYVIRITMGKFIHEKHHPQSYIVSDIHFIILSPIIRQIY